MALLEYFDFNDMECDSSEEIILNETVFDTIVADQERVLKELAYFPLGTVIKINEDTKHLEFRNSKRNDYLYATVGMDVSGATIYMHKAIYNETIRWSSSANINFLYDIVNVLNHYNVNIKEINMTKYYDDSSSVRFSLSNILAKIIRSLRTIDKALIDTFPPINFGDISVIVAFDSLMFASPYDLVYFIRYFKKTNKDITIIGVKLHYSTDPINIYMRSTGDATRYCNKVARMTLSDIEIELNALEVSAKLKELDNKNNVNESFDFNNLESETAIDIIQKEKIKDFYQLLKELCQMNALSLIANNESVNAVTSFNIEKAVEIEYTETELITNIKSITLSMTNRKMYDAVMNRFLSLDLPPFKCEIVIMMFAQLTYITNLEKLGSIISECEDLTLYNVNITDFTGCPYILGDCFLNGCIVNSMKNFRCNNDTFNQLCFDFTYASDSSQCPSDWIDMPISDIDVSFIHDRTDNSQTLDKVLKSFKNFPIDKFNTRKHTFRIQKAAYASIQQKDAEHISYLINAEFPYGTSLNKKFRRLIMFVQ